MRVVYIPRETFIVRALISNGVDINSLEVDGGNRVKRTALIIAANQGHTEVVQMLIENSATVDAREGCESFVPQCS